MFGGYKNIDYLYRVKLIAEFVNPKYTLQWIQ